MCGVEYVFEDYLMPTLRSPGYCTFGHNEFYSSDDPKIVHLYISAGRFNFPKIDFRWPKYN